MLYCAAAVAGDAYSELTTVPSLDASRVNQTSAASVPFLRPIRIAT